MQLGDARLGQSRLGTTSAAGSGHVTLSPTTSGTVSALDGDVGGTVLITANDTGSVSGLSAAVAAAASMELNPTGAPAGIVTGTAPVGQPLEFDLTPTITDVEGTTETKYPGLTGTIEAARDIPERERLESYLKRPFQSDYPAAISGGTRGPGEFAALMDLVAEIAQYFTTARDNVLASRYVDLALGQALDHIGGLLMLPRRTGESDPHYRVRLKAHARALTGEATIDEIRSTLALLLDCNVGDVYLTEPPNDIARFDLEIDQSIIDAAPVSIPDVTELVLLFRAGGVKVTLSVTGSFTHRSLEDIRSGTDLGEKGYNEAYYSGRII